jgi:hypothetical protein
LRAAADLVDLEGMEITTEQRELGAILTPVVFRGGEVVFAFDSLPGVVMGVNQPEPRLSKIKKSL